MRRSWLVSLLLVVGFALISTAVWNLSGCSKGGGGGKGEVGPAGIMLTLGASPSETPVFRTVELTATLRDAYNMAVSDEKVYFYLKSKGQVARGVSASPGGVGRSYPRHLVPRELRPAGRSVQGPGSVKSRFGSEGPSARSVPGPGRSANRPVSPVEGPVGGLARGASPFLPANPPLGAGLTQTSVDLDEFEVGQVVGEVMTDSMGVASLLVTSQTLRTYTIYASAKGVNSNEVVISFVANPMYRCSLYLTTDKTMAYADEQSWITITGKLVYSEEPVVGATLAFKATTTTGEETFDVNFLDGKTGTTNSNGEVTTRIQSLVTGTYNICVEAVGYECPSGSPIDSSAACKYVDFRENICELDLALSPETAQADGVEQVTAEAYLTMNGEPVGKNVKVNFYVFYQPQSPESQKVYFTSTGTGIASAYTDENGKAVQTLVSYGFVGDCEVVAESDEPCPGSDEKAKDEGHVTFKANDCVFTLAVDKTHTLSDGRPESQVEATGTLSFNGKPVENAHVRLSLGLDGAYFVTNHEKEIELVTDENGQVKEKFGSTSPGECELSGRVLDFICPGSQGFLEDSVSVFFERNICQLTVTADPSVANSLGEPVTVTATATINGNPAPKDTAINFEAVYDGQGSVTFETTNQSTAVGYTDENGQASVVVKSLGYVGTCEIRASSLQPCPGSDDKVVGSTYVTFKPNVCEIVIVPDKMVAKADGIDSIALTIYINVNGEPLAQPNIAVSLSLSLDKAYFVESQTNTLTVHTDQAGRAAATIKSAGGVGDCKISATTVDYNCPGSESKILGSAVVSFQTNVCLLTVNVPSSAKADGSEVTATATLTLNGEPVGPGTKIRFSAGLDGVVFSASGQGTVDVFTDVNGIATAKFYSMGYTGRCTITAQTVDYICPGSDDYHPSGSAEIIFEENLCKLGLTLVPMVAKADGSEVTATATLTLNGQPVANQGITFRVWLDGVFFSKNKQNQVTEYTDSNGQAVTKFYSDGSTGDCKVVAITETYTCPGTDERPTASQTMKFEPNDYIITLTARSTDPYSQGGGSAPADGKTLIHLTAVLKDKNGHPVVGGDIRFGCENGCIERCGSPVKTNDQGVATTRMWTSVMVSSDPNAPDEDVSIWADYTSPTAKTHRQAISFRFRKIGVTSLTACDYSILEDGSEETKLTAKVRDTDGYPVEGVPIRLASQLGVFVETGANTTLVATNANGEACATLKGHCLHGLSTESATIEQEYCDFCDQPGQKSPAIYETQNLFFEEGGNGCYKLEFIINPENVCLEIGQGEDEEYRDSCYAEVWLRLTKIADGSPVAGKKVTAKVQRYTNPKGTAYFNYNVNLQQVDGTTDADGYVRLTLDATADGEALLRAWSDEFRVTAPGGAVVRFSKAFCTRVFPSFGVVDEGGTVKFYAAGGCSKHYTWEVPDGGVPTSGITSEYEEFEVYWTKAGQYKVTATDEFDDWATAVVIVREKAKPSPSPTPTPTPGRKGSYRAGPTPTPAPRKK